MGFCNPGSTVLAGSSRKLLNRPRPITPDMIGRNMGKNMKDFGDALFPDLPVEKRMEVMAACMNYETSIFLDHPGTLYPNVQEVLSELSKNMSCSLSATVRADILKC